MFASLTAVAVLFVAAQPAPPVIAPAPKPLTLEEKAECGIALTMVKQGMVTIPAAMNAIEPEQRGVARLMFQTMDQQGQKLLDEAFAEGAARQMSPRDVYLAGVRSMFASFADTPGSAEQVGALMMKHFMNRCMN